MDYKQQAQQLPQSGITRMVDDMGRRINPINFTFVYAMAGLGLVVATFVALVAYAIIPAYKLNPDTKKQESNMGFRVGMTGLVLVLASLICGAVGYSSGKRMG